MPKAIELEDGTTIENIGEDRTVGEIREYLIKNNYPVPSDIEASLYTMRTDGLGSEFLATEEDPETYADWVNTGFEIGPALAAGSAGVARGAQFGAQIPIPHPGVKAIAAGVSGLAGGIMATAPLVFGGKFVGETVEALIEGRTFDPKAALNASIDAAQTDAMAQAAFGVGVPAAAKIYRAGKKKLGGKFTLNDEQIERVIQLQKNLKEYGSSLLPTMIQPKSWGARFTTDLAAVSEVTSDTIDGYLEGYETYMGNQIAKIIQDYKGAPDSAMAQGQILQTLIRQTDEALDELVAPMYRVITETGRKVSVNPREAANNLAADIRKRNRGLKVTKDGREVPTTQFVSPGQKSGVEYLEGLPSDLNFWEAHQRLSTVKKKLYDISSGANVDKAGAEVWAQARDLLQKSMDDASAKLSPELQAQYRKTTAFYRKGSEVVNREYFKKALDVLEPSEIGAMMTRPGFQVGLNDVRELRKLADEYAAQLPKDSPIKESLNLLDPMESIRRGYLESALKMAPEAGESSLQALRRNLSNPKFRDTFDNLFTGTATRGKIDNLLEELSILERASSGGGGGAFSLTVRSGELAPVRDPSAVSLIKGLLPGFLARKAINPETIDKTLSLMKASAEFTKRGQPVPKSVKEDLLKLMTRGQMVGLGSVGAMVEERPITPAPQGMLTGT